MSPTQLAIGGAPGTGKLLITWNAHYEVLGAPGVPLPDGRDRQMAAIGETVAWWQPRKMIRPAAAKDPAMVRKAPGTRPLSQRPAGR